MPRDESPRPFHLLVDLSQLLPGGANGGVKPFVLEYLAWIGRQRRVPVRITYLTTSRSHAEVRALARAEDELVCVHDDGTGERPDGHEVAPRERRWLSPPVDLAVQLGADVLYCPLSWTEFRCPGVPLVATIVDVLHRDFPFTLAPADNAWRETLFADLLGFSDRFQCISAYTRGQMHYHFGVPLDRMFLTHIAIQGRFRALPPGLAGSGEETGEAAATPYFFYPANAWVHKNHEAILLAYYAYRRETRREGGVAPWGLVLTGHEDQRMADLRAVADSLGLLENDAVRFAGHVSARQLERIWRGAGALVFPSLHEGFGIPLVEAMEHGVPILCSAAGSLPEVGGDACLYADARRPTELAVALRRLAGDEGLRRDLVARGRERLRAFRLEREASAFLDELCAAARAPVRPTTKGIWPDGWTGPVALLGPAAAPLAGSRVRLRLRLRAIPAARRVRLFAGGRPLGGWDLAPGHPHEVKAVFFADDQPVRVEVPDAHGLSAEDPRQHGVWVEALTVTPVDGDGADDGEPVDLLRPGGWTETQTGHGDESASPARLAA